MTPAILTVDQGTTSSRAILFDDNFHPVHIAQQEYQQHYPRPGWVEHDPEDIWQSTLATMKEAIEYAEQHNFRPRGIGLVNQRETTLIWDRLTGKPVYPAIVWQDRRTASHCRDLKEKEQWLNEKTGLRFDPYFSACKIAWILNNVKGAREKAENGELAFGTVDCFLIWRFTDGQVHATDTTNASRTNLFNINTMDWDDELLELFNVPRALLPQVKNCADDFGITDETVCGFALPIAGVAGDQQAALIGQGCYREGEAKTTFGTGCFALINSGQRPAWSKHNLLTTVAYTIDGETHYAIEGSIFVAGAAVQWLRDSLGILPNAAASEKLASEVEDDHEVVVVPAFTGLGAPYWDPTARGAIYGLTRGTTDAHLVRATLESIAFQTDDLMESVHFDGIETKTLRVDGGMVANNWFCQFLADTLDIPVERPKVMETTALGAAYLAALQLGMRQSLTDFTSANPLERAFEPNVDEKVRQERRARWKAAVKATQFMSELQRGNESR